MKKRILLSLGTVLAVMASVLAPLTAEANPDSPIVVTGSDSRSFSPNGDGFNDQLALYLQLSEPGTITVQLFDSSGATVRTLADGEDLGTSMRLDFDGRDDAGQPLPVAEYDVVATATDAQGDTGEHTLRVGITQAGLPQLSPAIDGTTVAGVLDFELTPNGQNDIFSVTDFNRRLVFDDTGDGTWRATWDSRGEVDGAARTSVFVRWNDQFGYEKTFTHRSEFMIENGPDAPQIVEIRRQTPDRSFSPNGDTYEDAIDIEFDLSRSATVRLTVTNAEGALVRSLIGNRPDVQHLETRWNGTDKSGNVLPEGEYFVNLEATAADGNTATGTMRTTIDYRSAAPGSITAPVEDTVISGQYQFVVTPSEGFELASVRFRYPKFQFANAVPTEDGTWRFQWNNAEAIIDGRYEVLAEITWFDAYGTRHDAYRTPVINVEINNGVLSPIAIKSQSQERSFSPNGDGFEDRLLQRHFDVTEPPAVKAITVTDAAGNTVASLSDSGRNAERITTSWDGTDDAGVVVADGVYTITVDVTDADGNMDSASIRTSVRSQPPAMISAPPAGSIVSGLVDLVVTPTANNRFDRVDFNLGIPAGRVDVSTGAWLATFDSALVFDGPTTVEASIAWRDEFGTSHATYNAQVDLMVENRLTREPIRVVNNTSKQSFSPNGDGYEDSIMAEFGVSQPAQFRSSVTNSDGELMRVSLDAGTAVSTAQVSWDGTDDAAQVVPDGLYSINLLVQDGAGNRRSKSLIVEVASAAPVTVLSPAQGATVAGAVDVLLQPADYVDATYIATPLFASRAARADGIWRVTLDTTELDDGPAEVPLRMSWIDRFGFLHSVDTVTLIEVLVDNAVADPITIASKSENRTFSPDGDRNDDVYYGQVLISRPGTVTATVVDIDGAVVRQLLVDEATDAVAFFRWYGLDEASEFADEGRYFIEIVATDEAGNVAADVIELAIRPTIPAAVTAPVGGPITSMPVTFEVTPTGDVTVSSVSVSRPSQAAGPSVEQPDGTWTRVWSRGIPFRLINVEARVEWIDEFGANHVYLTPRARIAVDNGLINPIVVTPLSSGRVFSPDGDGIDDRTGPLEFQLSEASATASATVTNTDGDVVRTLGIIELFSSKLRLNWDGIGDDGAVQPEGLYELNLAVTDPQGDAATASIPVELRVGGIGAFVSPLPEQTVSGLVRFEFVPTSGVEITELKLTSPLRGLGVGTVSGSWIKYWKPRAWDTGRQTVQGRIVWTDQFGAEHFYTFPDFDIIVTSSPVPTPVVTPEPVPTPTVGVTPSVVPTPVVTPGPVPTPTVGVTPSVVPTPVVTPGPVPTPTVAVTPTPEPTPTPTSMVVITPTPEPTPTPSPTP